MALMGCYTAVETRIGNFFASYGRFVARHPWKFILIGFIVNGLLGVGMITISTVTDVEEVYTPINNQAKKDAEKVVNIFPDLSDRNFIRLHLTEAGPVAEIIVTPESGTNVLTVAILDEVKRLYEFVIAITIEHDGQTIPFSEICAIQNSECSVDGNIFFSDSFKAAVEANDVDFPTFIHPSLGAVYYEGVIGSPTLENNGTKMASAKAFFLRFSLRTDTPYQAEISEKWEIEYLKQIQTFSSDVIAIAYGHSFSIDEELDKNINGDIAFFVVTIVVMITYACLATFTARVDCVGQRMMLGFAGTLAAGVSIVSAFGLVSACGVKFVSIVGVVPFLLIGIGVDDMFILLSGITHAPYMLTAEDRIGEMMRTSGVAITITSLTDVLAFAAGTSSSFLAVRNFCIYTGVAVLFCYINQATIFVGCIAVNENRVHSSRHFLTCRKTKSKRKLRQDGESALAIFCCAGRRPISERESESLLDRLPKWLLPKLVTPVFMKVFIILLFAGYLGVAIWGVTMMEEGLVLSNLLQDTSYYYRFQTQREEYFPDQTPVSFVFDSTLKYSDSETQTNIDNLVKKAQDNSLIRSHIEINWLKEYKRSMSYNDSSETEFINGLETFLAQPMNRRYENDVVIDKTTNTITSSRVYVVSGDAEDSNDLVQMMLDIRNIADESLLPVFAFSPLFLRYEQFVVILQQTLQTLGIAVGMVFFVTILFMPHPLLLIYIVLTVAMITVGIFGFLAHLNLTLSSITMIHLIMSIGFSVDFTAHICHGYMAAKGTSRGKKVESAILQAGAPVFHGAVSSLIGVAVLAFAKSFIFRTFFKVMSLVITFGIAHALLFLPVILSLIGPISKPPFNEKSNKLNISNGSRNNTKDLHSSKAERGWKMKNSMTEDMFQETDKGTANGVTRFPRKYLSHYDKPSRYNRKRHVHGVPEYAPSHRLNRRRIVMDEVPRGAQIMTFDQLKRELQSPGTRKESYINDGFLDDGRSHFAVTRLNGSYNNKEAVPSYYVENNSSIPSSRSVRTDPYIFPYIPHIHSASYLTGRSPYLGYSRSSSRSNYI